MKIQNETMEFTMQLPTTVVRQIEQTATYENQLFESMVNKLLLEGLDAHLTVRQLLERTAQHYGARLSQQKQQSPEEVLQNLRIVREQVADELYP